MAADCPLPPPQQLTPQLSKQLDPWGVRQWTPPLAGTARWGRSHSPQPPPPAPGQAGSGCHPCHPGEESLARAQQTCQVSRRPRLQDSSGGGPAVSKHTELGRTSSTSVYSEGVGPPRLQLRGVGWSGGWIRGAQRQKARPGGTEFQREAQQGPQGGAGFHVLTRQAGCTSQALERTEWASVMALGPPHTLDDHPGCRGEP